jgi:ribosome-associated protein
MQHFKITGDTIQLNQLLKASGLCETGADANTAIENKLVQVNGKTETRKRNKLAKGAVVDYNGITIKIE